MPFIAASPDFFLSRPDVAAFSGYQGMAYRSDLYRQFDVTRRQIEVIRCGQAAYHLFRPTQGRFLPKYSGHGEFVVDGFQFIFGQGSTPNGAYESWVERFHGLFQRVYLMRPFEMDANDEHQWSVIQGQVNVERYRLSNPIVVLQQGRVVRARPLPEMIEWEDGNRERVHLKRMPPEFASYLAGQPFEAVVHRDPVTHKLLKVEYVKRLKRRAKRNAEASKRLWDSIPDSGSLPEANWD